MKSAQSVRHPLGVALDALLATVTGLTVFPGEVPDKPPLISKAGIPDQAGRVAPYAVTYTGGGILDPNPSLDGNPADLLWGAQVTFAAGYRADLEDLLDRALPVLRAWAPVISGVQFGRMRPPAGFDPGPIRRDDAVRPPRFYLPTLWELHVADATTP